MKESGTFLVPTAMAVEYTGRRPRNYPPEIAAKAKAAAEAHAADAARGGPAGVKIAFGTDSGRQPARAERRGVRPAGAVRRARPARGAAHRRRVRGAARHREETGTLEPGKQADMVAAPGDALADIRATEKVVVRDEGREGLPQRRAR